MPELLREHPSALCRLVSGVTNHYTLNSGLVSPVGGGPLSVWVEKGAGDVAWKPSMAADGLPERDNRLQGGSPPPAWHLFVKCLRCLYRGNKVVKVGSA